MTSVTTTAKRKLATGAARHPRTTWRIASKATPAAKLAAKAQLQRKRRAARSQAESLLA